MIKMSHVGHAVLLMKFQDNPPSGIFNIYRRNIDFKKYINA